MKNKAVLLIHGFAGGNYDFNELSNDLQLNNNYDVFTFTLPGHDKLIINNIKKEAWIEKAEEEIEKIINNNYKEIYIIGHSMGGVIAAYLASKYKTDKLVLASPAFKYLKFSNNKIDFKNSIKLIPNLFKRYTTKEVLSRILKMPLSTVKEFSSLVEEHTNDIKKVNCPTLIIWGNKDDIVPKSSINYVYNNISSTNVKLIEFRNLNHNLFNNNRYQDVKKEIITFFETNNNKKEKKKILK